MQNRFKYKIIALVSVFFLLLAFAACSKGETDGELASQVPKTDFSSEIHMDTLTGESEREVASERAGHTSDSVQKGTETAENQTGTETTDYWSLNTTNSKNETDTSVKNKDESKPNAKESEKASSTQKSETSKADNAAYLGQVHLYLDAKNALPHIKGKPGYDDVPANGVIFDGKADLYEGDSVSGILKRELDKRSIPYKLEQRNNYLSSLAGLKEKDKYCGSISGWLYYVNGVSPGVGIGSYTQSMKPNPTLGMYPLKPGDKIDFYFKVNQKDVPPRS